MVGYANEGLAHVIIIGHDFHRDYQACKYDSGADLFNQNCSSFELLDTKFIADHEGICRPSHNTVCYMYQRDFI